MNMFSDIKVPFDSVMLYNVAKLKEGITISDVEEHVGTMCNIVKNKYKGFLTQLQIIFKGEEQVPFKGH